MKYCLFGLVFLLHYSSSEAQSIYGLDPQSNKDNFGVFVSLSSSNSETFIRNDFGYANTAKGANSTVPAIGFYYQKGLGSRFSARIGFSLGRMSNAYKYAAAYDSLSPVYQPGLTKNFDNYERAKTPTSFVQPQIELGYLFGPIKDMYLIEIRAGVGLQVYLGKNTDSVKITRGTVENDKLQSSYDYSFEQSAVYGDPDVYGSIVTNIYAGMRWQKTENQFLNRFSIGIQATLPVSVSDAGYALIQYRDGNGTIAGRQRILLSQYSFGIRAAFHIL